MKEIEDDLIMENEFERSETIPNFPEFNWSTKTVWLDHLQKGMILVTSEMNPVFEFYLYNDSLNKDLESLNTYIDSEDSEI